MEQRDVVVVGAGQAGLSSAWSLRRQGVDHVVLDQNPGPGGAWQHRWPSLSMQRVHGIFGLPGMRFSTPSPSERASTAVPAYFARYERSVGIDVRRPVTVTAVRPGPGRRLVVESDAGTIAARAVVNATGTWTHPFWPRYPGQETFAGRQLHAVDYPGPEGFAGQRVVVVGGGATGIQLLVELAEVAETTWVTRRPPVFREEPFDQEYGREVIARVDERVRAGQPPESVVSATDLVWTPELVVAREKGILRREPVFDRLDADGVVWEARDGRPARRLDADVVLWCTGWRAALSHLAPLQLREPGGGIRMDGTRVVVDPRVHLVGYGPSASTVGANRAGRTAVREIRELLAA
ncbi:FAD-dependent oxidoreductase [Auraticoccus monumenti]|uniref:Predicted flavoprotein CzcO associated with the cation diffusion facilitator CzcD n=1 Tax=Auraticoccus monumenti TaxID=675864 RepID=A0A1G6TVX0_9ACTN|nr:FAD-dependent oxidoreductase [Auraticoccus monumenti]SDD32455.1 Predicted flavoprotein CzcO associated with the cation diffusion facilitator CzcD [Auraticoccus monumenti]